MNLYQVAHTNDDGENLDLFVWANDKTDAVVYWRLYYEDLTDGETPRVFHIVQAQPPTGIKAGAQRWGKEVKEL